MDTEQHILFRWDKLDLPDDAKDVARRFIERAAQVVGCAAGLLKLHRLYAAPTLIRTLFELSLQFEYLMEDPGPRSKQYREFTHITRHKQSQALANNPAGPVSIRIAQSPLRPEGEKRNKAEYERVVESYRKGDYKMWDKWFCMTTRKLAEHVKRLGEYDLVFKGCSAWAHGDPFSTEHIAAHPFTDPQIVVTLCMTYYARMLLKLADVGKTVLTAEQHEGLRAFTKEFA